MLSKTDRKIIRWRNSRLLRWVIAHSIERRERQRAKYAAAKTPAYHRYELVEA